MAKKTKKAPGAAFTEATVEADGFNIRYLEAGTGEALVYIHGATGIRVSHTHDLLAKSYRVIVFEVPGFGASPANEKSKNMDDLAGTLCTALGNMGIESYNLMGMSFGGKVVLSMALLKPDAVKSIVLLSSAAIRPENSKPPEGTPEEIAALQFAHPEDQPPIKIPPADIQAKQLALVKRMMGPPRDEAFENALKELEVPVLAMFGTVDRLIPLEMAHHYAELLPNCHLMMVYDAAHAMDVDRPEAVSSVAADFLERQDKFLVRRQSDMIHP
ncbi:MAG: alpha/beta hydrolase [Rhodospirillales bacterium]|nr:alpha/beta hydrolase [Rhodospirillales bacterium]